MAKAIAKKAAAKKVTTKKAAPKTAAPKNLVTKSPVKKTEIVKPAVKAEKPKKEPTIKYADKSAGQPELIPVFEEIKNMILAYEGKRALKLLAKTYGQANLISHKPVMVNGKPRNEFWFASALIQKGYVGFYFSAINAFPEIRKELSDAFMKTLKGGGCFHIKNTDPGIMKDIKKAIKLGYDNYVRTDII